MKPKRRLNRLEQLGRTVELAVAGDAWAAVQLLRAIDLKAALELLESRPQPAGVH